jgi:photosystem II stability/assembly factor-like uncharacterized protein
MTALLVATDDDVVRIERRDDDWQASVKVTGHGAQCLAVDPRRPQTAYAGCRGAGVWRTTDGGQTWEDTRLPASDVFSVAVSPVDGAVYAGCEPSMLYRSHDGGKSWVELETLRDIPSAPTWSFPPRPWTSHVRWIAPSPHDAGRLLVGIELGGLMLSTDGGASWADHRPGARRDVHALAWHPTEPGRAFEAGGDGPAWTVDGGESWLTADDGLDRRYTWGLAVDPDDPDRWYVSAARGPGRAHRRGSSDAAIYVRHGDRSWERLDGGLPDPLDLFPYALLATGDELFAGLADGSIYSSEDRGESWRALRLTGDAPTHVSAMVAVP